MIRRTIVRYTVLSLVLTLRNISMRVKKRFPTIRHVEEAGLILEEEKIHYDKLESQVTANNWMPLVWAANIATHARSLNKVSSDHCLRLVITELTLHRDKLGTLVGYDLVSIPLVYTQTMVVVVVSYIFITLISHQPITEESGYMKLTGFTISSLTDFIIYVGLMKVATVMLNPFGEDDDDFELNAIIDRHLTAAYMIVDEMHEDEPEVVKDAYWDEIVPRELPYTVGSVGYRKVEPNCSEDDTQQTVKQPKHRFSSRRRSLTSTTKRTEQNKIPKNSKYYANQRHINVDQSKATCSKKNTEIESDMEIYDFPQQPSTSKQYFNQPKRY